MLSASSVMHLVGRLDPVILEVGANDGTDTLRFLEAFPGATIHCFEPEPRAQAKFTAAVRDPRAKLFPFALGAHDGTVEFHRSNGSPDGINSEPWDKSGSIRKPKHHLTTHSWCKFAETIKVPVMRLDTWAVMAGVDRVDFIWADVQGAERDLIEGGRETLARTRLFYTEYNDLELYEGQPTLCDIVMLLKPTFALEGLWSDDALFRNVVLQ